MSRKVYVRGIEEDITSTGPSRVSFPISRYRSRQTHGHFRRLFRRKWLYIYQCTFGPVERGYRRLFSSTSRQTIRVVVSLYALLYIFFTVPFRIAFHFDPFRTSETWTTDLSVYVVTDAIIDTIGLIEFSRFYRQAQFQSFNSRKTTSQKVARFQASRIVRTPSFDGKQQGEKKWTLASIKQLASTLHGNTAKHFASRRDQTRTQNVEFVLDIFAILPLEVISYALGTYNLIHVLRILKLCRLYRIKHCFTRITKIYSDRAWIQNLSSVGITNLVRNIGLCAGLWHWVACGYFFIARVQCGISFDSCLDSDNTSWVILDRLNGATVTRTYARTLYWASRTLFLLGFDELAPVSNAEIIYVIFVTILGALFTSSLLASFLFIFRFWNLQYATFAAHVDNARAYMKSQNIPRSIRHQVIEYFTYSWSTHHSLNSEEALQLMPRHLRLKVVYTLKATRVKQVSFLAKENIEFINLLANALVRRVYSPGDHIIEPKLNAQMFFVIRGSVALSAFDGSNSKECQTGSYFADICLIFPEKFEEKAVARSFCELYVLSKVKFDEKVTEFFRDSESDVRARMTETLERYLAQLLKTKRLLGGRGRAGSDGSSQTDKQRSSSKRNISWRLPGSAFRSHWETARLLAIIYVAFEVPYFAVFISLAEEQHVFEEKPGIDFSFSLTLLVELFFGMNIILRSHFLVLLDPIAMLPVEDPSRTFAEYKADGFYLDCISWLPTGIVLEALTTNPAHKYSWFFRLFRLLRLREVSGLLWKTCDYYSVSSNVHLVISLLLGVTFMLHIVGCTWYEMAWISDKETIDFADEVMLRTLTRSECLQHATHFGNCSWVVFDCYAHIGDVFPAKNPASMYHPPFAYLRSMYWAIVTLTTVGYGDITAYSTGESFFAAFWIFVGGVMNFAVIGAMSSTISQATAPHREYIEKLNAINGFLERMGISEKLSSEIRRFYHIEFARRKQAYESHLLSNLPDQLCYKISSLLHSEAVKSIELFDSATVEFLKEVTGKFRHRTYQNGDTICLEGDICREFFVLLRGSKVNVFFRTRKVPVRALHQGDCYGVNEFLLKRAHSTTLVASSLVNASVMTLEQFDIIQRKFDEDLRDMTEEAQTLCVEQYMRMHRVARNLEKLKLQPHVMSTSTLFYQGETTSSSASVISGLRDNTVRNFFLTRNMCTNLWSVVITSWGVYNAIFVIFRICFHSHLGFSSWTNSAIWIVDIVCDVCFAMDIYLQLFYFGCSEVGIENLVDRKEFDRKYLRSSRFKWHIIASMPIYTPFVSGSLVAGLCRLPRLARSVSLWTYLDDAIVQIQQHFASHNVSAYLSPAKLMIILVLVAHYVGCIFFWLSEVECEHIEQCWMVQYRLFDDHQSLLTLYVTALYWAITTILLAGLVDIVPRGTAGTLWTCFTCLCCTFIVGHIVGEISDLIQGLSKESKQYKNRLASFSTFANMHELTGTLRNRVEFFFHEQLKRGKDDDLHNIVQDLSANLQLQLMLEIYGGSIILLPISRFLTSSQINNLALRLKPELFIPGDNILVEGTFGNRLCMLRKGVAAVFWTRSVTSVAALMEGSTFGEIAFFIPDQRRLATVRATTLCEVLYVTKHDWQELWARTGDPSDDRVQKHARCAIADWVHRRLHRYQKFSLNSASKIKLLLAERQLPRSSFTGTATTSRVKRKLSTALSNRRSSITLTVGTSLSTAVSDMQLLERKAEYLQTKTEECVKVFGPAIAALHTHRRSFSGMSSHTLSRTSGFYRSMKDDTTTSIKTIDIHGLQFMVEVDPIDRHFCDSLSDKHLRNLENECWKRFKRLAVAQYRTNELLGDEEIILNPGQCSQVMIHPARNLLRRVRSFRYDEHAKHKQDIQRFVKPTSNGTTSKKWKTLALAAAPRLRFKRICAVDKYLEYNRAEFATRLERMARSRSLQRFGREFYERIRGEEANQGPVINTQMGFDFELLQRSHRAHFSTQRLLHRLRSWKDSNQAAVIPKLENMSLVSTGRHHRDDSAPRNSSVREKPIHNTKFQHLGHIYLAISRCFRRIANLLEQLGKLWDLVMLLIAIYHLEITTFKVCFSIDLTGFSDNELHRWSVFEIFLDVLSFFDVCYKFHRRSTGAITLASFESRSSLTNDPALRADVIAILPLELFLCFSSLRVPLTTTEAADDSWWATRSLLRVNRLLFAHRIEPLSEKLLRFIIYERKLPVNETLLSFMQGVTTYLTMGHLLACTWFFINKLLAMLMYDTTGPTEIGATSLLHKYLVSLLFAMECISTLFNGNMLSMRSLDVIVEIGITLWSIYIYGALVGVQAELFDARARREAAFEQTLGQLQYYLVQNDVPKGIKRQIKTYYARMWHRRQGEAEFAAVENVTRALYEDVVLAAISSFVVQVPVFRTLDDQFLRSLLVCLQYVICSENEEVYVVGDMDRSMYFVANGHVMVKTGSSESTRHRGEFFGELSLLYGISRLETCVTAIVTELYRLDHEPYEQLLREFPEYRARNKMAWTQSQVLQNKDTDVQIQHSYIYRSVMELLSRLNKVDPLEAKDLVLKSRDGARRKLEASNLEDDAVRCFHSSSPSPALQDEREGETMVSNTEKAIKRSSTIERRPDSSISPQIQGWSSAMPNATML